MAQNPPVSKKEHLLFHISSLTSLKEDGNKHFKNEEYEKALSFYCAILRLVGLVQGKSPLNSVENRAFYIRHQCHLMNDAYCKKHYLRLRIDALKNISAVHLKRKEWAKCIDKCKAVLCLNKNETKSKKRISFCVKNLKKSKGNTKINCEEGLKECEDFVYDEFGVNKSEFCKLVGNERKGFGLFASKNIKKGTTIFTEKAFITVSIQSMEDIHRVTKSLTSDQKRILSKLHSRTFFREYDESSALMELLSTNSMEMGETERSVFLKSARLNHSCCPNVVCEPTDVDQFELGVVALRDIGVNEEMFVNYHSHFSGLSTKERRQELMKVYGFYCECTLCTNERKR